MITIKVSETEKGMHVEAEFNMDTTRGKAREMFIAVMGSMKRAHPELFHEALHKVVEEELDEMLDCLDEEDEDNGDSD